MEDWILFIGFLSALLFIFIFKAIRVYNGYKGKIFKEIYSSFIEYYFKYKYKKNLSVSGWLNQEIGFHRILFNSYLNQEKKLVHEFVTIFHEKGIMVFYIVTSIGEYTGNDTDKYWILKRDNKSYRILNPKAMISEHVDYIKSQFNADTIVDSCVLFTDNSDFKKLKTKLKCAHYHQLTDELKQQNNIVSRLTITELFKTWTKKK